MTTAFSVDIWSDVVCPFCYLGEESFRRALEQFDHRDEVEVTFHAFELDRSARDVYPGTLNEMLAKKYNMSVEQAAENHARLAQQAAALDLPVDFDACVYGNTLNAHRLMTLATAAGRGVEFADALHRLYFAQGVRPGDEEALLALAAQRGLDVPEGFFQSDAGIAEVRADEAQAEEIGITGVPAFVLDQRFLVVGARSTEEFLEALNRAWARRESHPRD
jgi:predicted DsbA family dithiol-disulfide isomerase